MLTEREYNRQLNSKGWSFIFKKATPALMIATVAMLYSRHCDLHEKERTKLFYNKSKLYGTSKNPQY